MKKFTKITSVIAPLNMINIDTDMIIPKQFLKTIKRTGLGKNLFHELRFNEDGSENKDFILNDEKYRSAKILLTGDNFGCGSSREHAPWAIDDFGIRCVISTSFADIFYNNCFNNGICPITLSKEDHSELMELALNDDNSSEMTVDLENKNIIYMNKIYKFEMEDSKRERLLNGLDQIGLTLEHKSDIENFEIADRQKRFWI